MSHFILYVIAFRLLRQRVDSVTTVQCSILENTRSMCFKLENRADMKMLDRD